MDMAKESRLGPAAQLAHEVDVADTQALSLVSVQAVNALQDIVFGSVAGIVGKVIEYPFDTVKVRLQSQPEHLPLRYSGPLDCFKQSLQHEGFAGLYRGISAPLVGAAVETSSLFFSYNLAQDVYRATLYPNEDSLPMSALLVCGAVAGAFTSIFLTPIELVKCKMQVPTQSSAAAYEQRPMHIIASIYRHQGLAGFWRGQLGTLIREAGGCIAWFGSNEGMKRYFRRRRNIGEEGTLPVHELMAAGAMAGMSYNFLFFPADTIKSRMQTEDVRLVGGKRTFLSVGTALYRQQGLKGLYRGCGITVARSAPSSAVIFTVFEALKKKFS